MSDLFSTGHSDVEKLWAKPGLVIMEINRVVSCGIILIGDRHCPLKLKVTCQKIFSINALGFKAVRVGH